ncbi:unnamed protein product, partial [marine sediment metagenome]
ESLELALKDCELQKRIFKQLGLVILDGDKANSSIV